MPLGLPDYVLPNVHIRGMIGRLLTADDWRRLDSARDVAAMLLVLRDTTYGPQLADFEMACPPCELLEARLNANLSLRFARVIDLTPEPGKQLVILLKQLYEVDNLKTILRGIQSGERPERMKTFLFPLGRASSFDANALLGAKDVTELVLRLQGTPYGEALRYALARYEEEKSLFPLEVALDLDYYRRLWRTLQTLTGTDRKWAELLVGTWFDIVNVLWALRYRYYYRLSLAEIINYTLPYGYRSDDKIIRAIAQGEDVTAVLRQVWGPRISEVDTHAEGWLPKLAASLHRYLAELAHKALLGYPFHLGVILAYLILKRFEVEDLMVLAEAKMAGLRPESYRLYMVNVSA